MSTSQKWPREEPAMIARVALRTAPTEQAERILRELEENDVVALRERSGNRGVLVMRHVARASTEFLVLSLWDSMAAVEALDGMGDGVLRIARDPEHVAALSLPLSHFEVVSAEVQGGGWANGSARAGAGRR